MTGHIYGLTKIGILQKYAKKMAWNENVDNRIWNENVV